MNIPYALQSSLRRSISNTYSRCYEDETESLLYVADVDMSKSNTVFVPSALADKAIREIQETPVELVHRLVITESSFNVIPVKKTANSLVRELLEERTNSLKRVRTQSGEEYYGNKMAIFRKSGGELRPLMVLLCKIDIKERRKVEHIIFVDTDTFINSDLISRFIVKKAIPFYSMDKFEVRVTDCSKFFKRIPAPTEVFSKNSVYENLSYIDIPASS